MKPKDFDRVMPDHLKEAFDKEYDESERSFLHRMAGAIMGGETLSTLEHTYRQVRFHEKDMDRFEAIIRLLAEYNGQW